MAGILPYNPHYLRLHTPQTSYRRRLNQRQWLPPVHISVYKDRYEIDQIIEGESVDEVLEYVQFNPKKLVRNVEAWVTASMKAGTISPEEGRDFVSTYRAGLFGYTYLERD